MAAATARAPEEARTVTHMYASRIAAYRSGEKAAPALHNAVHPGLAVGLSGAQASIASATTVPTWAADALDVTTRVPSSASQARSVSGNMRAASTVRASVIVHPYNVIAAFLNGHVLLSSPSGVYRLR